MTPSERTPNSGNRRLASIANTGLAAGQFSNFTYTTTPENFITGITESSDAATVYPPTGAQSASYNTLNQLTNLSGQALTWDADGNLLSDGTRTYAWDAENRLVKITYPAHPGEQTSFAYDGLSRRTAITSIAGVTTSYLWCGSRICQARNASDATTRKYYAEGEFVPGAPAQPYYYGPDQLGTVRRAFASTSSAPAYAYDPYGQPLQATAPLTDFTYAGMFTNADSGLYLTQYRAYDPTAGRWLSRDPIGEESDPAANLYRYGQNNPVAVSDPSGLLTFQVGVSFSYTTFWGGSGVFSAGVAIDSAGNVGTYYTGGVGAGVGAGFSGGISVAGSSAKTICDLRGPFADLNRGGGWGESATGNGFWGQSGGSDVVGGGVTYGGGLGSTSFAGATWTSVNPVLQF